MSVPNAEKHLTTGKPVPPELLLNIPTVAKVVFGLEPGCVVHYSAIKEKLQLLGPHMQKTTNGPELMNYFAELRKTRNKWAVAFANYQSQMMTKVVLERNLYGRVLTASERSAMPGPAWKVCSESLTIVTQQLLAIKTSREFAEKVRILEACAKQYTAHSRLKAVADRAAIALAQKKQAEAEQAKAALAKQKQEEKRRKQAEARKAKKAAAQAATKATEKNNRIQSVFNPDMPDFAQFMNKFSTVTTSPATNPAGTAGTAASIMGATVAATGSPKPAAKRVSKKTPPAAKLTDAGVKKRPYVRKAGNSPGNRAAVNPSAVQFSVNPSAAQFSVSPAASQSSGNSYTTQSPFNPPVAQFWSILLLHNFRSVLLLANRQATRIPPKVHSTLLPLNSRSILLLPNSPSALLLINRQPTHTPHKVHSTLMPLHSRSILLSLKVQSTLMSFQVQETT